MSEAFYSQAGQDEWVLTMHPYTTGFFVEVGAYDGVQTSNTYALELLGWSGICIEASPDFYRSLCSNRISQNVHAAVGAAPGVVRFAGDRVVASGGVEVPADTLTAILDRCGAPRVIDYMSIDIEGGELAALAGFDFGKYRVNLMTVEHNLYANGPEQKDRLFDLLTGHGFRRIVEDAPCLDPNPLYHLQPYEDWYAHETFLTSPPGFDA